MLTNIHPTALIAPGAKIGNNVTIQAYAVIDSSDVIIEDNVTIRSHVFIDGLTIIGEGTSIYPFVSIGTKAQDKKHKGEKTLIKIGKRCEIRESVTINSSTGENTSVVIGDDCLLMNNTHVGHNSTIGNHVTISANVMIGGHAMIEDYAVIGAGVGVHQHTRVGCYAMVGAMSRLTLDLPPFLVGGDTPFKLGGLNLLGLKRHGIPLKTRSVLSKAFKILFRSGLTLEDSLAKIEQELDPLPEVLHFLKFCRQTKRGLVCLKGISKIEDGD